MYYLFLEIGSFRQLSKLQSDLITGLLSRLEDSANRHGAVAAGREAGCFLFRFPVLEEVRHGPVLDAAFEAYGILSSSSEELAGYAEVIDHRTSGERDVDVLSSLREFSLSTPSDEQIWLTGNAAAVLGAFVESETKGGRIRVLGRKDSRKEPLGASRDFLVLSHATEEILDRMAPWINGEEEPGTLLVHGDELSGVTENVHAAIERLEDRPNRVRWPTVVGRVDDGEPYAALVRGISEEDLDAASDYLEGTERAVYGEKVAVLRLLKRRPFATECQRLKSVEVQAAYTLYLTARLRRLRDDCATVGMVIEVAHALTPETLSVVVGALEILGRSIQPILVIASEHDSVPFQVPGRRVLRYKIPLLTAEELAERATVFLSEGARRRLRLAAAMKRTGGRVLSVYHHFSNLQEEREFESVLGARGEPSNHYCDAWESLSRLPRDELELLFLIKESKGTFEKAGLAALLLDLGVERVRAADMMADLVRRGFLRDEYSCAPAAAGLLSSVPALLGDRATELRREFASWCVQRLKTGTIQAERTIANIISQGGMAGEAIATFQDLLSRELDCENLDRAAELERDELLEPERMSHVEHRRRAEVFRYVSRFRRYLMQGDLSEADRYMARTLDPGDNPVLNGHIVLQHGRLMLMRARLTEALRLIKRAVMSFQETGRGDTTARAQLEFGLVLLGKEQLSDAHEYFTLVHNEGVTGAYTLNRAAILATVCLFLESKYTRVLQAIEQYRGVLLSHGFRSWLLFVEFLEARTLFELGRYEEAGVAFQRGMSASRVADDPAAHRVHHLWAARCGVYLGFTRHELSVFDGYEPDSELLLFRAELAERENRPADALSDLDEALEHAKHPPITAGETFNWRSGFASVEDLAIGRERDEPIVRNFIRAYRGYMMARLGRLEEGMAEVHDLTRRQRLALVDPYRRYYYYFYSVILAEAGPDRLDAPLTVLGKSVKHLRECTSQIDHYGQKTDFMHKNYWNRRLMDSAKQQHLF